MIKVVALDLDNTLYEHSQYIQKSYEDISKFVSNKYNINNDDYYDWIFKRWIEKGSSYNKIFKESYLYFNLPNFSEDISKLLDIYHSSKPELYLEKEVISFLTRIKEHYKIIIITDGVERTQMYKIDKLGITKFIDKIYISGKYGRGYYKPSTKMFELCLKEQNITPAQMIYIGDNPILDYAPCESLGIPFIRIIKGEYSNLSYNHLSSVKKVTDILEVLKVGDK